MQRIVKYLTPFILLVYMCLGVAAVMGWRPVAHVPFTYRIAFAVMCAAYVIYRGYRYYVAHFKK